MHKGAIFFARTVPKFYGVTWIIVKECLKVLRYCNQLELIWVCRWIKIFCATWMASVIMMMWEEPGIWTAWLILHLMANNSTSIDVILMAWWSFFFKGLLKEWTWAMNVIMLFLTLVSEMTITVFGSDNALKMSSLNLLQYAVLLLLEQQSAL